MRRENFAAQDGKKNFFFLFCAFHMLPFGSKSVYYCSTDCQREHWHRGHKGQCKVLAESQSSSASLKKSGEGLIVAPVVVPNVPQDKWLCSPARVAALAEFDRENLPFHGCGIENLGNTCFVNSVLQVLTSCSPLMLYLESREHTLSCSKKNEFCSLCALTEWAVLVSSTSSDYILRPVGLLRNLTKFGEFQLGMQSDAAEFYMGCVVVFWVLICNSFKRLMESCHNALFAGKKLSHDEEQTSLLRQLFGGFKAHQVKSSNFLGWVSDLFLIWPSSLVRAASGRRLSNRLNIFLICLSLPAKEK